MKDNEIGTVLVNISIVGHRVWYVVFCFTIMVFLGCNARSDCSTKISNDCSCISCSNSISTDCVIRNKKEVMSALKKLRKIGVVSGHAVGFGAVQGEFHALVQIIARDGTDALFQDLLKCRKPIARCAGLYCLAQKGGIEASEEINKYLSDPARIEYIPFGCIQHVISVGEFALILLLDKRDLDSSDVTEPMISQSESFTLYIRCLSRDELYHLHENAENALKSIVEKRIKEYKIANLRAVFPDCSNFEIIKALGRLPQKDELKSFFLRCLTDTDLKKLSRMTAASALSRYADPDLYHFFIEKSDMLENLEEHFSISIRKDMLFYMDYKRKIDPINKTATYLDQEKIRDQAILAFSIIHPCIIDDLKNSFSESISTYEDVRRTIAETLESISRKTDQYTQKWNIYSDLPYQLHDIRDYLEKHM